MTHSHDRTLLASLGFADPDKREPLHDLACEYLAQPSQAERLVRFTNPQAQATGEIQTKSVLESVISKGEGQYRTTIGFLDLRIDWQTEFLYGSIFVEVKISPVGIGDVLRQIRLYQSYLSGAPSWSGASNRSVDAETFRARLNAMGGGERSTSRTAADSSWVLAVAFNLDPGQIDLLRENKITPIHLSDEFTKWFEERQKRPAVKMEQF